MWNVDDVVGSDLRSLSYYIFFWLEFILMKINIFIRILS